MTYFTRLFSIILIALALSATTMASPVGQIDFADLSSHYGEPMVEINLGSGLMNIVGAFAKNEDPEVAEVLSKLEFIKVRVYSLNGDLEKANTTIDNISSKLRSDNWETLVTVNNYEENQKVRIFSKMTNDIIDGIVVMVVSPEKNGGEAVFINIVGEIEPSKIAKVAKTLDVDIGQ